MFFTGRRASGDHSISVVRADSNGATLPAPDAPALDDIPRVTPSPRLGGPITDLGEPALGYSSDDTCTSATCPEF